MKRFYVLWFFFSAGWGYLISEPFPGAEHRSITEALMALPVAALTFLMLIAVELLRMGPKSRMQSPSLSLMPWSMPIGTMQFVLATFVFCGIWGVIFSFIRKDGDTAQALLFFSMGVGGFAGLVGARYLFRKRFSA